jgi:2-C-methyl-D-erythritol 4-phosphate cytidylyltransferase
VVCVLPAGHDDDEPLADRSVPGGATRSASVRAGLAAVPDSATVIVVHDAARPLAPDALFQAVIQAVVDGADAAIPAVPVHDTIRHVDGGVVDRTALVAVQTPQAFRAAALRDAHAAGGEATDDASLVEAAGGTVVLVPGNHHNLKITDPGDLRIAATLLEGAGQ